MAEIKINLSGKEMSQVLNGLLHQGYEFGNRAEEFEREVIEYQFDENEIGEGIASANAKRCRIYERAAYSAYEKLKAEGLRLGLIS